jgi:hypothetical protein
VFKSQNQSNSSLRYKINQQRQLPCVAGSSNKMLQQSCLGSRYTTKEALDNPGNQPGNQLRLMSSSRWRSSCRQLSRPSLSFLGDATLRTSPSSGQATTSPLLRHPRLLSCHSGAALERPRGSCLGARGLHMLRKHEPCLKPWQ